MDLDHLRPRVSRPLDLELLPQVTQVCVRPSGRQLQLIQVCQWQVERQRPVGEVVLAGLCFQCCRGGQTGRRDQARPCRHTRGGISSSTEHPDDQAVSSLIDNPNGHTSSPRADIEVASAIQLVKSEDLNPIVAARGGVDVLDEPHPNCGLQSCDVVIIGCSRVQRNLQALSPMRCDAKRIFVFGRIRQRWRYREIERRAQFRPYILNVAFPRRNRVCRGLCKHVEQSHLEQELFTT